MSAKGEINYVIMTDFGDVVYLKSHKSKKNPLE